MVLINKAINEVTVKLVYYGPGLCGKTTNLEKIYANPKLDNKGKMISMSTETDRTLFFDFMPMELGTIAGQKVRVQLYTVPGQVFYDATRKLVLRGADGVVFVADSQNTMRESNLDSLANLKTNLRLNRIDPEKVALVFQLNKRDLPNVHSVEEMTTYLGASPSSVVEASAKTGVGVTATLRAAVSKILDNLKNNVDVTLYDEPPLSAPDMTQRSGVAPHSAGSPKLSMKSESGTHAGTVATPEPVAAPFSDPETFAAVTEQEDPFETGGVAVQVDEDDPFASVAAPVPEVEPVHVDFEDPFAAPPPLEAPLPDAPTTAATADAGEDRTMIEELLANASAVVSSLEVALERAREAERKLRARL
jgi:signal recognition particle receptor subunit beta